MSDVVQKIQKLLELASAERNPSPHEAESAMAKVQELLIKYELDMAEVEQSAKPQNEEFVTDPYGEPFGREPMELRFASMIVSRHFHVSVFWSRGRLLHREGKYCFFKKIFDPPPPGNSRRLVFLGRKTNVAIAEYVHGYLCAEFKRQWERYHKETRQGNRLDFYRGLCRGLDSRLEQEREVIVSASRSIGKELMRRNVAELELEDYVHSVFPRVSHTGRRSRGVADTASLDAGSKLGRKLNIRPAVNEAKGQKFLEQ
jgi:hypothetical protein